MKVAAQPELETTVAARVAGEDIACGDFVAVMNTIVEVPSFLWNCSPVSLPPDEPIRIRFMADEAGQPHKVIGVCLPFVYVETPSASVLHLDTRKHQIVRLDGACARMVWKRLRSDWKKAHK